MAIIDAFIHDHTNAIDKKRAIQSLRDAHTGENSKDIAYCVLVISDKRCPELETLIVPKNNFDRLIEIYRDEVDELFRYQNDPNRSIEGWAFVTSLSSVSEALDVIM